MNDRIKPPVTLRLSEGQPDELDRLLRGYFRKEMPRPWPPLRSVEGKRSRPVQRGRGRWPRLSPRLVLVAAMVLLLVGYVVLASKFPGSTSNGLHVDPQIGGKQTISPPRIHDAPKVGPRQSRNHGATPAVPNDRPENP
jgi:hypothetical protein